MSNILCLNAESEICKTNKHRRRNQHSNRMETNGHDNGHDSEQEDFVSDNLDPIELEAARYAGKTLRRHSAAVFSKVKGVKGVHRRPLELYLIRIYPACRAVWFYLLQVRCSLFF